MINMLENKNFMFYYWNNFENKKQILYNIFYFYFIK